LSRTPIIRKRLREVALPEFVRLLATSSGYTKYSTLFKRDGFRRTKQKSESGRIFAAPEDRFDETVANRLRDQLRRLAPSIRVHEDVRNEIESPGRATFRSVLPHATRGPAVPSLPRKPILTVEAWIKPGEPRRRRYLETAAEKEK
jgi:hypothetical protein